MNTDPNPNLKDYRIFHRNGGAHVVQNVIDTARADIYRGEV